MFLKEHSLLILPVPGNRNLKKNFFLNIDVITDLMHKSIHTYEKHADGFI